MNRKGKWLVVSALLFLPACEFYFEPADEGCLSLSWSPWSGHAYYDGRDFVWEFDLYLSECSGASEVDLYTLQLEVYDDCENLIYYYSGGCGFIKDIFGTSRCRLDPGEVWVQRQRFTWRNPWTKRIDFMVMGVDEIGERHYSYASFSAYE